MSSLKSIYDALSSVNDKKENLRKAYEKFQSHSSSQSFFTLQWKDLEERFDSILKSIDERLKDLESKEKQAVNELPQKETSSEMEEAEGLQCTPRPELKSLCVNMDGKGLLPYLIDLCAYIIENRQDLATVRAEVAVALKSALDPAKLVLDAMQGFYPSKSKKVSEGDLDALRKTCLLLLDELALISPQIEPQVQEEARKLAVKWRGKLSPSGELEIVAFLQLLSIYDLVSAFSAEELLDLVASIARRKQVVNLFRALNIPDKAPDLIKKLVSKGNQLDAVKFVYAFELVDKFRPVPLLKDYVVECKKFAEEIRKKQNNSLQGQHVAMVKELSGLRRILNCMEEHKLESQHLRESLDRRIEQLEKQKAVRKQHAAALGKPHRQQQTGNKRARSNEPTPPEPIPPLVQASLYQPGMISAGIYGLGGQTGYDPYGSSSVGQYSLGSMPLGYGGNPSPNRSHLYTSELHTPGLYDTPRSYDGSALLPHYRPSYYP